MRPLRVPSPSRPLLLLSPARFADSIKSLAGFIKAILTAFFRRAVQRKVVCSVVALNLLMWPGPGLLAHDLVFVAPKALLIVASQALNSLDTRIGSRSYEAFFIAKLFSRTAARPQRETMASRAANVARIRMNPHKFVGYLDEGTNFAAVSTDLLNRTVHGVKFTWQSSNTDKLQIDETGAARFLQPGLAWITCRAGSAVATAPVLIRPNHRPRQTDAEWRADQRMLGVDGNLRGDRGPATDDGIAPEVTEDRRSSLRSSSPCPRCSISWRRLHSLKAAAA